MHPWTYWPDLIRLAYCLLRLRNRQYAIGLLGLWLLFNPGAAQAQTPEPAAGNHILLGFHLGQGDALHLEAAQAAGGSFAVVVFNWANIEPEPNYLYWEQPDAALRAAEFYGIEVVARLDQPPAWAQVENGPTPWNLAAYANFAQHVAERYGNRLAGVIIWNEPNLNLEWHNQPPDPAGYAEMLRLAYLAIKDAAPALPVLMGGLASTEGEGDWAINDLDYLQALYAAGANAYFDGLTAHPYGFGRPPDDAPEKFRPNFRRLELYHELMEANGDGDKPIWVTEMGWLTRTDNPKYEWQVVDPQTQADYILQAITYAETNYPWVERLGLWQLNAAGDAYGYDLWTGAEHSSPAYQALVEQCPRWSQFCHPRPANLENQASTIEILAPDVIIRLGDRGTLYPHWVHLHQGGQNFSPDWQGAFFLTAGQAHQHYDLLLETMQIDQSTNQLLVNGTEVGRLQARPRPDPTSTWVTQRLRLPAGLLQPGPNTLSLRVGPRNPNRQYAGGRWENMQFRHIRLVPPLAAPPSLLDDWQRQPAPTGWSETNRLRPGLAQELWLTGIAPGELWRGSFASEGASKKPNQTPLTLENEAGNRPDLVFNDLLPLHRGELAATAQGLFWRPASQPTWEPVSTAPASYAYVVSQANHHFYAGFEGEGLWQADTPLGPWQRTSLTATTVVDLIASAYRLPDRLAPLERLYATTPEQIFVNDGLAGPWQPLSLPGLPVEELEELGESPADKLQLRLFATQAGDLLVRRQDRLWQQSQESPGWRLVGPESLYGKLYSVLNCCEPGALVGTHGAGLWRLAAGGEWQRLDQAGFFETTDVTELLQAGDQLYAAGALGLFQSPEGQNWQKVAGLPSILSDLVTDPANPARWLAATPAGLYRSQNGGERWEAVSPPWTIWDLAWGPGGRLFAGSSSGLVWTNDLGATTIEWQKAEGLGKVYFLKVKPHPVDPQTIWSGTWGNNIGISQDGGQNVEPLHNGLETLSGLDLIWHATPGQVTLATFEGLYRTDDSGQSWFRLPGSLWHQTVYSLLQTDDGAIWAGAADGLWVSRDYGVNWEQVGALPQTTVIRLDRLAIPLPPLPETPPFIASTNRALVYRPRSWLWAGTEGAGLWLSQDNGLTWRFAGLPEQTVYQLFFNPLQPGQLVAATDQGIWAVTVSETELMALRIQNP